MDNDGLTVTQVVQRVDVSEFATEIDAGNLRVSSFTDFNVADGVMDALAAIEVLYIPETLTGSLLDHALGSAGSNTFIDDDPNTWQTLGVDDAPIAAGTRSLLVHIFYNNNSLGGNPGYVDSTHLSVTVMGLLGDVNGDGEINLLDVAPFVDLLVAGEFQVEADINQDGAVDLLDVQPFVDLLSQ